jgi:hypothetical protein
MARAATRKRRRCAGGRPPGGNDNELRQPAAPAVVTPVLDRDDLRFAGPGWSVDVDVSAVNHREQQAGDSVYSRRGDDWPLLELLAQRRVVHVMDAAGVVGAQFTVDAPAFVAIKAFMDEKVELSGGRRVRPRVQ